MYNSIFPFFVKATIDHYRLARGRIGARHILTDLRRRPRSKKMESSIVFINLFLSAIYITVLFAANKNPRLAASKNQRHVGNKNPRLVANKNPTFEPTKRTREPTKKPTR